MASTAGFWEEVLDSSTGRRMEHYLVVAGARHLARRGAAALLDDNKLAALDGSQRHFSFPNLIGRSGTVLREANEPVIVHRCTAG